MAVIVTTATEWFGRTSPSLAVSVDHSVAPQRKLSFLCHSPQPPEPPEPNRTELTDLPPTGTFRSIPGDVFRADGGDEEESAEHTLLVVREVSVYKIPPRPTSGGYKCGEWLQSDRIWSGRLRVVSCRDRCEIRLEDPGSGELFAACFVYPGSREASVETVLDSSRYFVLRIEDGRGKHAFIGLGFNERNEAFDFNVALSDHDKYVKRTRTEGEWLREGVEGEDADNHIEIHPVVNHRLKDGEIIHINVKHKISSGTGMLSSVGLSTAHSVSGKPNAIGLAPPPGGSSKIRSPLPPPPNDPAAARRASNSPDAGNNTWKESTRRGADPLSNLLELERNLPSSNSGTSKSTTASGWAAF